MKFSAAAIAILSFSLPLAAEDVRGKVLVDGAADKAPETPIVVFLDFDWDGSPGKEQPVISQSGARFQPDFLVVVKGQTVQMPNDDMIAHTDAAVLAPVTEKADVT